MKIYTFNKYDILRLRFAFADISQFKFSEGVDRFEKTDLKVTTNRISNSWK